MDYIVYSLIIINLVSTFLMYIDKRKAIRHQWRIPERTLFLLAMAAGSPGILIGMYMFRHKTKHASFVIGIPLILMVQIYLAYNFMIK